VQSGTQHSALSTRHAARRTQHSELSTQHSALGTQHSALSTQHSELSTQHSALSSLCSQEHSSYHWESTKLPAHHTVSAGMACAPGNEGALSTQHSELSTQHSALSSLCSQEHSSYHWESTKLPAHHTVSAGMACAPGNEGARVDLLLSLCHDPLPHPGHPHDAAGLQLGPVVLQLLNVPL
jgi:hypothetical protein